MYVWLYESVSLSVRTSIYANEQKNYKTLICHLGELESKTSIYSWCFVFARQIQTKIKKKNRIKRLLKCNINEKMSLAATISQKDQKKTDDKDEVEWNETDTIKWKWIMTTGQQERIIKAYTPPTPSPT